MILRHTSFQRRLLPCKHRRQRVRCAPSTFAVQRVLATKMTSSAFRDLLESQPRIILGSGSSSRKLLMNELADAYGGFSYEVISADIDEKALRAPEPEDLVLQLAHAKADAIIAKIAATTEPSPQRSPTSSPSSSRSPPHRSSGGLLITCDQVVTHRGKILEKPSDAEEARAFIRGYGGSHACTIGSVVCTNLTTGRRCEAIEIAEIHFNPIPEETIEELVEEGEVMWCAGGLCVEHVLVQPHVIKMVGSIDTVMGLGKDTVVRLLCEAAEGTRV